MDRFFIAQGKKLPTAVLADILADAWCRGKKPETGSVPKNGPNCHNCAYFGDIDRGLNNQCSLNGSGIGEGEQAVTCKDYEKEVPMDYYEWYEENFGEEYDQREYDDEEID
jgi:hypothetical protein